MNSRIPNRQKAPENSDSALVSSQFQPRPFTLGPQSEEASPQQQETPDLQTQLERAKRFGPDFSRVKVRAQAPPVTFESKLLFGEQSNQEDPVTDSMAKPVSSMPASPVNLPPIQRLDAESVGNQPNPLAARMMPPIQRRDAEVVKPPNPLAARMMPVVQRRDAEVVKPLNPLAARMMPVVQRQSERAALNQSQPWIQRIEEQPEAKLEEELAPVQAKLENATIERQPEVEQESEKEDQQTTTVGKLPTLEVSGASGGDKLKSDEAKDRKAQGIEELPSQLGVASPEAATRQTQSKTDNKPNAAAGSQPKQQPTAQGDSSKNAKADGAGVAGKDGAAPDAKGVVKAATKHIPPETADVAQKAQTQNNSRKEEVAAKKAEATKAVEEASAKKDTVSSASQKLTSAQASFAAPQPKAMFATSSEGISAVQPEEVLGTAGNGLVIYQTDNPEKSLAAANAGAFVHQIPEDKAANTREQQRIQAEAAIAQFTASGSQRTAQISALGTTIGPRIQAAAGQATASVDAAIAQNQSAIINGIDQARAQVQSQAQGAKSQITGQHDTTVAAIQASTTAARDRLQTEYQASLAQLGQLESTMAGRIAEPFNKAANDFRTAGVTVGNEAIQIGETFKGQYAGESPPEPSNFITEFLESFDRDTYVQNWRQAKTKAAGDVAAHYRDGLNQSAGEKAKELSTSQSEVLKGMQNLVSTTRTELEVKYNAALQELSQSEQSALETATQALNSQLQSIDQNLNTNLASLDQMQATQLSQLESLGQQQKLGINAQAGQVTAALQDGVNQATTNLQGAFQQFANQAQGIEAPNIEVINSVIAEAQGQLDSLMATTQTELETGINKSEQGIVQQAQQTVGSINTAGQQAASSGSMIAQEFTASMTQEVQNATQAFTQLQNGHTTAVNASAQKTAGEFKNLTGKVQQQLDGVVQNLTTKLGESVTQLENGLRGSLKGSDQNPSIEKAIDDKAKEAADQVQPAWKSVVKVLIDIVITVAVTVAIAALAASGVGLVAAIGLAALIGATGALVKQGANDLIDGKLSSWQTYATQAGFGAVGGVLQLVGLRGAEKAAGLLTNTAGKTGAKFGIEALGEAGADISQRLAAGEQFSLAMLGVSFGTSLLGGAGGEALNGAFGKLGAKLGVNKIDNAALKTGGEFVTDTISETATDVTSQVVFEGKDLSWQTVGESAGTSAFGNLAGRGANRAYGDRLRNLGSRSSTSTDVPNLNQPLPPVADISTPTQIIDPNSNQPVGQTPAPTQIIDPNTNQPVGETPVQTPIIDPNTNQPVGQTPVSTPLKDDGLTQTPSDPIKDTFLNPDLQQSLIAALPNDLQGKVPINVDPELPSNTVRVHYDVDANGLVTNVHMRVGPNASAVDIQLHAQTVRLMQNYSGFSGRIRILKERIHNWISKNGEPPVGSRAWEAKLEVEKLPRIIDERLNRVSQDGLEADAQTTLRADIENLQQQLAQHQKTLDAMDTNPGVGFVAAKGKATNITEGLDPALVRRAAEIEPEIYKQLEPQLEGVRGKAKKELKEELQTRARKEALVRARDELFPGAKMLPEGAPAVDQVDPDTDFPFGFYSREDFDTFSQQLRQQFESALDGLVPTLDDLARRGLLAQHGLDTQNGSDTVARIKSEMRFTLEGSSVTGRSYDRVRHTGHTGEPFDVGRISDYDTAIVSPTLFKIATRLMFIPAAGEGSPRTQPLTSANLAKLGLTGVATQAQALIRNLTKLGHPVNFKIYSGEGLDPSKLNLPLPQKENVSNE